MRPSPGRGFLGTLIDNLTSKISILLFNLIRDPQTNINQHTISYYIKVSYDLLFFSLYFCRRYDIFTDTHFIHESFKYFFSIEFLSRIFNPSYYHKYFNQHKTAPKELYFRNISQHQTSD